MITSSDASAIALPPCSANAGPSSTIKSYCAASLIARSTVAYFSTAISGSIELASRRVFHLVVDPWSLSRSPIFTCHPEFAYSTAIRRDRADLPTPPFCEIREIIIRAIPRSLDFYYSRLVDSPNPENLYFFNI